MLNFCPYDFEEIDEDNLAYELVFAENWSWERVKKETIIDEKKLGFIDENDRRRYKHFRENTMATHVMLLENRHSGGKNGLKLLLELIECRNAKSNRKKNLPIVSQQDDNIIDNDYEFDVIYDPDDFEGDEDRKKLLYFVDDNGRKKFIDEYKDEIMYAIPCCPKCHNRLPIGWDKAEDFGAVSLMAPSGSGKTTFLLSMMNKDWDAFQNLDAYPDDKYGLNIAPAHLVHDELDATYYEMKKRAEEMCKTNGHCPDNTDRNNRIPPVFLNVQCNNHIMIIGIYDNAGENLTKMDLEKKPNLRKLLENMYAELFLFDPADLNITLPKEEASIIQSKFADCEILSIEEQGSYQKENRDKRVSAMHLLEQIKEQPGEKRDISRAMEVYKSHIIAFQQNNCREKLKSMYFLGIIIKSDLLEQCEEVLANKEYEPLFNRKICNDMLNLNSMDMRNELVQSMIKNLGLFGEKNIDDFKFDFGEIDENGTPVRRRAVSWHCISALGCSADSPRDGGMLHGEYAPIRVAEPLATCIFKRIMDNGWI